jgi:molybdate transport system ATP-binding protein
MAGLSVDIHLHYPEFTLDLAQSFANEGVTALFGPSGSGKSTLLRVIAGFERAATGRVSFGDEVWMDGKAWMPPHRRGVGFVFQDARLFPHLTARQNLDYAHKRAANLPARYSFDDIVDVLDLAPLFARRPGQLSGGEKQRVAMGRALLARPRLLLLDEPLAALDDARKAEILPYLERVRDDARVPMLYVSHSAAEVARLANTVVALAGGRVLGAGPVAEVFGDPALMPAGPRAIGAVLMVSVVAHHDDGLSELDAGGERLFLPRVAAEPGSSFRVRIAAHDVILSRSRPEGLSALNILSGTIADIREGEGPGAIVVLDTPAGRVLSRVTRRSVARLGLAPGIACHAVLKTVSIAPEDVGGQVHTASTAP